MHNESSVGFDYDAVEEATRAPEQLNAARRQDIAQMTAKRMSATALRELIRWVVLGDAQERFIAQHDKQLPYATRKDGQKKKVAGIDKKRFSSVRIGQRAIAAAWVIDATLMAGLSLRSICRTKGSQCTVSDLSRNAMEFKDRFGVQSRGMKANHTRPKYARTAKGNQSALKSRDTLRAIGGSLSTH